MWFRNLILGMALLLLCVGCSTQTTIANNLSEREANEIVVLLVSKGIQAEKTQAAVAAGAGTTSEVLWNISVPSSQITDALAILNQAGLPRVKGKSLLDLFGAQGLVPSDLQDRIRYQEGLSSQLASTIRKMDGIIDANVQITFPQGEEAQKPLTASVYVKHKGILDNPNSLTITKIKRLVSSALPGLSTENVSVVTDRALYADISLEPLEKMMKEHEYVSIWGIVVAKDSATSFRLIFYFFIIFLFLFACILAWFIWKFLPIIKQKGGFVTLVYPRQYESFTESEEEAKSQEKGGGGEE